MKTLAIALLTLSACVGDLRPDHDRQGIVVQEVGVRGTPDTGLSVVDDVPPYGPEPEDVDGGGEGAPEAVDIHDLYFGDSGWRCCYTTVCRIMRDKTCANDEVPTTNGYTSCCSPDIGQCVGYGQFQDYDAGI